MDTLRTLWAPSAALAAINLFTLRDWLNLLLVSLSIAYLIWKWRREARKGS